MTSADPLHALAGLPGVPEAVESAREAVAQLHRHPANRRGWPTTAAEAAVRAARASAATEGADIRLPQQHPDGDLGQQAEISEPVLAGSLRVAESLGGLLGAWQRAPLQVLARMHVLAAAGLVPDSQQLGRPRADPEVSQRLTQLAEVVVAARSTPAPVVAAVVHGELLTLRAFPHAAGVVARAAARMVTLASGLDSKGLAVPEVAHWRSGAEYGQRLRDYSSGEAEGMALWIRYCCSCIASGATEGVGIADAVGA